ncbi:hypothetical protein LCGC14_2502640 [marine sediment metagenome]|uniref:Uncharacterized protein n=1 Tax=marine sediment metagenome TaxID=412755 RepID=A0A0F9DV63_9ZZZZ
MYLPAELIQKIQFDYVKDKYQDSIFVFPTLDPELIEQILESFVSWADDKGFLEDAVVNISSFLLDLPTKKSNAP